MFLFFAFLGHMAVASQAGEVAPNGHMSGSTIINISLCYGFSLLVNAWCFYRISGGLFNPAVTLGLVITGAVPWMRGLIIFPVQLLGGICAAALAGCIVPENIDGVQTTLASGMSIAQGLFLEMFLTALLVFAILMLAAEKHKSTFVAPLGIGLALFMAQIAGVYYTGGSLNPARSFGPAVAAASFHGNHWIYWVGPLLGALISAGYYHFIKFFHYEEVNGDQDSAAGGFEATVHGYHPEAHPAVALKDTESLHQVMSGRASTSAYTARQGHGQSMA
ncbi:aquaporin-like protein [Teratosphaeria nubilosa]|uniref:Aquaporin-like protein n=1 Tax=Teratosphaeria nubilosa TaxID=161662 RepID=A0A6G1LEK3_9PEZI|nr:aquaporin-like protein [Teratosphaeria nubilosa]